MTLKLLAGEITFRGDLESVKQFHGSILCNAQSIIELSIQQKVILLMHMFGQSKIKGEIDKRIPELESIISMIDAVVISNPQKYNNTIKESDYFSPKMKIVFEGLLQNKNNQLQQLKLLKSQNQQIQSLIDFYIKNFKEIQPDKQSEANPYERIGLSFCNNIYHKIDSNILFKIYQKQLNNLEQINNESEGQQQYWNSMKDYSEGLVSLKAKIHEKEKQKFMEQLINIGNLELILSLIKNQFMNNKKVMSLLSQQMSSFWNHYSKDYSIKSFLEILLVFYPKFNTSQEYNQFQEIFRDLAIRDLDLREEKTEFSDEEKLILFSSDLKYLQKKSKEEISKGRWLAFTYQLFEHTKQEEHQLMYEDIFKQIIIDTENNRLQKGLKIVLKKYPHIQRIKIPLEQIQEFLTSGSFPIDTFKIYVKVMPQSQFAEIAKDLYQVYQEDQDHQEEVEECFIKLFKQCSSEQLQEIQTTSNIPSEFVNRIKESQGKKKTDKDLDEDIVNTEENEDDDIDYKKHKKQKKMTIIDDSPIDFSTFSKEETNVEDNKNDQLPEKDKIDEKYIKDLFNYIFTCFNQSNDPSFSIEKVFSTLAKINKLYQTNDKRIQTEITNTIVSLFSDIGRLFKKVEFKTRLAVISEGLVKELQETIKTQVSLNYSKIIKLIQSKKEMNYYGFFHFCKQIRFTPSIEQEQELKQAIREEISKQMNVFSEDMNTHLIMFINLYKDIREEFDIDCIFEEERIISMEYLEMLEINNLKKEAYELFGKNKDKSQLKYAVGHQNFKQVVQLLQKAKTLDDQIKIILQYVQKNQGNEESFLFFCAEIIAYCEKHKKNEELNTAKKYLKDILFYLSEEGEQLLKDRISHFMMIGKNTMILNKYLELILNSTNNTEKDFQQLLTLAEMGISIEIHLNNYITIDGKKNNLPQSVQSKIMIDQYICQIISSSQNPFISQYLKTSNELFSKDQFSLETDPQINSSIASESFPLSFSWKLIYLKGYQCEDIIFLERKNAFHNRIIYSIQNLQGINQNWILKDDRQKIFGQYENPSMFFGRYIEINNEEALKIISTKDYQYNTYEDVLKIETQLYLDKLLDIKDKGMSDEIYFAFANTLCNHSNSLRVELAKKDLSEKEQINILDYYDAFVNTFGIALHEAEMIQSGKFKMELNPLSNSANLAQKIIFKSLSLIPFIGQIASQVDSAIDSVKEFFTSAKMKKNAAKLLTVANSAQQSDFIGGLAKKIVLESSKMKEIIELQKTQKKEIIVKGFMDKVKLLFTKIKIIGEQLKSDFDEKWYGSLFKTPQAQRGNQDALMAIQSFIESDFEITSATQREDINKFFVDCILSQQTKQQTVSIQPQPQQQLQPQSQSQPKPNQQAQQNVMVVKESSCACRIF